MSANVTDQSTTRLVLAALLRTKLVGIDLPANAVLDEPVQTFNGQVVVLVEDNGVEGRQIMSTGQRSSVWFHENIHTFVLWRSGAEDTKSLLEKKIAEVMIDNYSTSDWAMLEYAEQRTKPEYTALTKDGPMFRHEVIAIKIKVYDQ